MFDDILDAADDAAVTSELNTLSLARRAQISAAIFSWLGTGAKKAPVPDIGSRLEAWRLKIDKLSQSMTFKVDGNSFEIGALGDSSVTLVGLTRGTDWFVGHPDLARLVASVLFPPSR